MKTGKDLTAEAIKHVSEEYVFGADVPFDNPAYKGPWDCAEFCSWITYQIAGIVVGCEDNTKPITKLEPYSGGWYRDGMSASRKVPYNVAVSTPGAVFVRKPIAGRAGHVAFSQGNGKTIEAMDSRRDVTESSPEHRVWNVCFLIDGVDYS
jgi:N-acetylmuramoyl-L-alanine amidase